MKNFFEEFKKFLNKGNALEMAVGVVIGGAFSSIVNSLVGDVIMLTWMVYCVCCVINSKILKGILQLGISFKVKRYPDLCVHCI